MEQNPMVIAGGGVPMKVIPEITPMAMLQVAVKKNFDIDKLQKLLDLEREWRADRGREQFVNAMAEFKGEPSKILKSKIATVTTDRASFSYAYAPLIEVVDGIVGNLSKYGFSHRWEFAQEGDRVSVTCVLTHAAGHSERSTLSAGSDQSGKKNPIQAVASTVSYLERYTLLAVTGLAASDMDNDGKGSEASAPGNGGDIDMMSEAAKLMACKSVPELATAMNSLPPTVQKLMLPTFQKRRGELSNAQQ